MRIWPEDKFDNFHVITIICLCLFLTLLLLFGCQGTKPPIWGQGEPPADWEAYFGKDNGSRLDLVQTRTINKQGQRLAELQLRVTKLEEVLGSATSDPNKSP